MNRLAVAFAVVLAAPVAASDATTWTIDPAHSTCGFAVKHLVVSTVRGTFGSCTGTIRLDDQDLTKSTVEATADVKSIDTRNETRDNDLRSPNFFDAEKYPTITFKSTKVQKAGDGQLKVTGDLTMKGITKPVTWDVTYSPMAVKGFKGELRRGFTAVTQIDRKEFGLTYSKAIEAGPVVGDTVKLEVDAEAFQQEPKAAEASAAPQANEEKSGKK